MRYENIVTALMWLVAILVLIMSLILLVEIATKESVIELKSGIVALHTYRDGGQIMVVLLEDGEQVELVNWTESIGTHVEVPVVVGTRSLLGILWRQKGSL